MKNDKPTREFVATSRLSVPSSEIVMPEVRPLPPSGSGCGSTSRVGVLKKNSSTVSTRSSSKAEQTPGAVSFAAALQQSGSASEKAPSTTLAEKTLTRSLTGEGKEHKIPGGKRKHGTKDKSVPYEPKLPKVDDDKTCRKRVSERNVTKSPPAKVSKANPPPPEVEEKKVARDRKTR